MTRFKKFMYTCFKKMLSIDVKESDIFTYVGDRHQISRCCKHLYGLNGFKITSVSVTVLSTVIRNEQILIVVSYEFYKRSYPCFKLKF